MFYIVEKNQAFNFDIYNLIFLKKFLLPELQFHLLIIFIYWDEGH